MENEILKVFNKITNLIGTITTSLTSLLGIEWVLFAGYLLLNVIEKTASAVFRV